MRTVLTVGGAWRDTTVEAMLATVTGIDGVGGAYAGVGGAYAGGGAGVGGLSVERPAA